MCSLVTFKVVGKKPRTWWKTPASPYRVKAVLMVSQTTFIHMLNKIRTDIQKDSLIEDAISPEYRVGFAYTVLAQETTYLQFLNSPGMVFLPFVE